jgi:uncharacterized protein YecA (UPF0149 family)
MQTQSLDPRALLDAPRFAGDEPPRNDPCPCASATKYKRCHGA